MLLHYTSAVVGLQGYWCNLDEKAESTVHTQINTKVPAMSGHTVYVDGFLKSKEVTVYVKKIVYGCLWWDSLDNVDPILLFTVPRPHPNPQHDAQTLSLKHSYKKSVVYIAGFILLNTATVFTLELDTCYLNVNHQHKKTCALSSVMWT